MKTEYAIREIHTSMRRFIPPSALRAAPPGTGYMKRRIEKDRWRPGLVREERALSRPQESDLKKLRFTFELARGGMMRHMGYTLCNNMGYTWF